MIEYIEPVSMGGDGEGQVPPTPPPSPPPPTPPRPED